MRASGAADFCNPFASLFGQSFCSLLLVISYVDIHTPQVSAFVAKYGRDQVLQAAERLGVATDEEAVEVG